MTEGELLSLDHEELIFFINGVPTLGASRLILNHNDSMGGHLGGYVYIYTVYIYRCTHWFG